METSIATFIDRRAVMQSATTKLINEVAAMADPTSVGQLKTRLDLLVLKEDSLKETNREIEQGVGDEALK